MSNIDQLKRELAKAEADFAREREAGEKARRAALLESAVNALAEVGFPADRARHAARVLEHEGRLGRDEAGRLTIGVEEVWGLEHMPADRALDAMAGTEEGRIFLATFRPGEEERRTSAAVSTELDVPHNLGDLVSDRFTDRARAMAGGRDEGGADPWSKAKGRMGAAALRGGR